MSYQSSAVAGSGTVPFLHNRINHGTYPASFGKDDLRFRTGTNSILLNPEDFSVFFEGRTKLISVNDSATRLDNSLEFRRSVAIANLDSSEVLYIGFNDSINTSVGSDDSGFPIFPRSSIAIDCQNLYKIYGITTGATITAGVMEIG